MHLFTNLKQSCQHGSLLVARTPQCTATASREMRPGRQDCSIVPIDHYAKICEQNLPDFSLIVLFATITSSIRGYRSPGPIGADQFSVQFSRRDIQRDSHSLPHPRRPRRHHSGRPGPGSTTMVTTNHLSPHPRHSLKHKLFK